MDTPFDVLGVDPGADEAAIERAYRERVKSVHPDHGGTVEEFRTVREAYEALVSGEWETATAEADEDESEDERDEDVAAAVTYLDYDVITDHEWEIDDEDLFEKAAAADLDERDYGRFSVRSGESLLEAAENRGFEWPFACRGGACANCAIKVCEGELSTRVDHVLPTELTERGFQLSCNATPITDELTVVYNVKHMPELEELLLPPRPFEQAYSDG